METDNYVYLYDGSFDGLMSCIFKALENTVSPFDITSDPHTLLPIKAIKTDVCQSEKVKKFIKSEFGTFTYQVIYYCFLSLEPGIEQEIFSFIKKSHSSGLNILQNLNDPLNSKLFLLSKKVLHEQHHIIEFLRFSDYNRNLVAIINPKYYVLPLIASHFVKRYPNENFLIFDEVHFVALIHIDNNLKIIPINEFSLPEPTEQEMQFRKLWKLFYDSIEIKERRDYELRRSHLPKRFWKNITELQEDI